MNVDMQKLLQDHGVAVADSADKHWSQGWLNVDCPFCGDKKKHLGWNVGKQYFNCWRSGFHGTEDTLVELLNITAADAWLLTRRYAMRPGALAADKPEETVRPDAVVVPGFDLPSADAVLHRRYLESRGYDVDKIGPLWGLRATSFAGDYKFRVMCPIYYGGQVVSFQGRDATDRQELRWKSCAKEFEIRAHKHCLGGLEKIKSDTIVIVEGFSDAWRLGIGSACTFGTSYLLPQIQLMIPFKKRFVVLDSEEKDPNAKIQADKLCNMLSAFSGETVMVELDEGDPGDMKQDDADAMMRSFGFKR
jgi:hypothetical protein